jgi:hypothetical protein
MFSGLQMFSASEAAKRVKWKLRCGPSISFGAIGMREPSSTCKRQKSAPISLSWNLRGKPSGKLRSLVSCHQSSLLLQVHVRTYCNGHDYGTWGPWSDNVKLALGALPSAYFHLKKWIRIPEEEERGCGNICVICCQYYKLMHHHSRLRGLLVWNKDSGHADEAAQCYECTLMLATVQIGSCQAEIVQC